MGCEPCHAYAYLRPRRRRLDARLQRTSSVASAPFWIVAMYAVHSTMQRFMLHGLGGGSVPGLSGGLDPYAISEPTGPGAFRRVATQHFDKHLGKYDTVLP